MSPSIKGRKARASGKIRELESTISQLRTDLAVAEKQRDEWQRAAEQNVPLDLIADLKRYKDENQSFGNVLAIIHRDGGHYITKHGHKKASKDAIEIISQLKNALTYLKIRIAFIGWPNEPLYEGKPDWRKEIAIIEQVFEPKEIE